MWFQVDGQDFKVKEYEYLEKNKHWTFTFATVNLKRFTNVSAF